MKEERFKAACNICVIIFILGLMLMCFVHSKTTNVISFSLMAVACWIGMICGSMLDRFQRSKRSKQRKMIEIREQDEKDIRSGRFNYVMDYSFDEYLSDNNTSVKELLFLIDDPNYPPSNYDDVYDHYIQCDHESRHESKEAVLNRLIEARHGKKTKKAPIQ